MAPRHGAHAPRHAPHRLVPWALLALLAVVTAAAAGLALSAPVPVAAHGGPDTPYGAAAANALPVPSTTTSTTTAGGVEPPVPASSLIATLSVPTPVAATPGGPTTRTLAATWYGAPSALPVIGQAPGWLEVRIAQRPNGQTGWISSNGVALATTPYRIVVDLTTRRLQLYDAGQVVLTAPAGIGTPAAPTPTGNFFVAFFAEPPSAGYGPFVMVLSAHSDAITDFEESGDALVAIHGPLGADAAIGTTGAAVSHGCIRLHLADLAQLRDVPSGSPVDIVA